MLPKEAEWFGHALETLELDMISPMLNVGSSTGYFRTVKQPWIEEFIFAPLRARGCIVINMDIKAADGVELVGDLSDHKFLENLRSMSFQSAFCTNLLEHVNNPSEISEAIASVVAPGGLIFASCPMRYPKHEDPIDTMYRPTIPELTGAFPGATLIHGEEVDAGSYAHQLRHDPREIFRFFARLIVPFYRFPRWRARLSYLLYFKRHFIVTCVVLERPS